MLLTILHSSLARRRLLAAMLCAGLMLTLAAQPRGSTGVATAGGSESIHGVPFIDADPVVVLATRQVCSLLGANQESLGIVGQDGGDSYPSQGVSYWTFGDTNLASGGQVPNTVARATDVNASDCITMTTKSAGNEPAAVLPKLSGEHTVWPSSAMVSLNSSTIRFSYSSNRFCTSAEQQNGTCGAAPLFNYVWQGVGLATLTASTLNATRDGNCNPASNCLLFSEQDWSQWGLRVYVGSVIPIGTELYLVLPTDEDVRLGKVPSSSLGDKTSYRYWDADTASWVNSITQSSPIWTQPTRIDGQPDAFSGLTVYYSDFLAGWVAMYSSGFGSQIVTRVAPDLRGPWSDQLTLIKCLDFVSGPGFLCYAGRAHPEFEGNQGQTIYVSYANQPTYQLYLQEVVLGTPVYQWEDGNGVTLYRRDGSPAPPGFTQKGIAFYASRYPATNLQPIYEWYNSALNDYLYSNATASGYVNQGVAFYAPTTPVTGLAPISRWESPSSAHVYSALNLKDALGYPNGGVAFYAKITNYRVKDDHIFPKAGAGHEVTIPASRLTKATLERGTPSSTYDVLTYNSFGQATMFASGVAADSEGMVHAQGSYQQPGTFGVTSSPLLPTGCCKLSGLELRGFGGGRDYELQICTPSCAQDPSPIVYEVRTDLLGVLGWGRDTLSNPAVGGIADLPEIGGVEKDSARPPAANHGMVLTLSAVAAGLIALGSAAWYTRRRWARR